MKDPDLESKVEEYQKLVGATVTEVTAGPRGILMYFSNGTILYWQR